MQEFTKIINQFQKISKMGYIKSPYANKLNAGGLTFEYLLGKKIDNLALPDYDDIEIKTKARFSNYPYTLSTIAFDGPNNHEALDIAQAYGTNPSGKSLYLNVELIIDTLVLVNNKYYFELKYDTEKFYLNIYDLTKNLLATRGFLKFTSLSMRLKEKVGKICFIRYSQKKEKDIFYFRYYHIMCCILKDPNIAIDLLKQNKMQLVLNLKYNKINNKYKNRCKNYIINLPQEYIFELFAIKYESKC